MKTALVILVCLLVAAVLMLFVLAVLSQSGAAPGLEAGRLTPCPQTPNCVCSEHAGDGGHAVEPIDLSGLDATQALAVMSGIIRETGGRVQAEQADYLAATFSSALFGFVDDLELRVDRSAGLLHVRSASRVGHGDLGVNRKRVQTLKALFASHVAGLPDPSG